MRDFDETRLGSRRQERDGFEEHLKTIREICWLQKTPKGDLRLFYYEADAEPKWLAEEIGRLQDPYARWMKSKWLEFAGLDFTKPSQELLTLMPEKIYAYEDKGSLTADTQRLCMAIPVLPDKTNTLREFAEARLGPRRQDQEAQEKRYKSSQETWWLQKSPQGDLLLVYLEGGTDMTWAFEDFARRQDPHATWTKAQYLDTIGLDLNRPLSSALPAEVYAYEPKKVVAVPQ